MLTYTADSLLALRHSRPPSRPVRKAILAHVCGSHVRLDSQLIARM